MATYFRDFADGISDFTEIPHVSTQTDPTWAIQNTDEVLSQSSSTHTETLAWNDIDSDGDRDDVEVLGQFQFPSTATTHRCYSVRLSTSGASRTCYYVRVSATALSVGRQNGATATNITSATLTINTNTWHWIRFRVNGIALQARTWADGGSEPGTWDVDTTDSTHSTVGHVGLTKGPNTIDHLWRKFGVGTNGDTAPSSGTTTAVKDMIGSGFIAFAR